MSTPTNAAAPVPDADIAHAADVLRSGGLVAFPTETVYGLGADATSERAVAAVFAVKGRPATDPLIVHVSGVAEAEGLGDLDAVGGTARRLAQRYWPGPLTVVVPRGERLADAVGGGRATVALRAPAHPVALALLAASGVPVAAPSANRFGRISPTTAAHVREELGERVDVVLDGGPTPIGVESTVVDCTVDPPRLLRPGPVPLEDLLGMVPHLRHDAVTVGEDTPAASPGTFVGHYAPMVPLVVVGTAEPGTVAALVQELRLDGLRPAQVDLAGSPGEAARHLYANLRAADSSGAEVLVAGFVDPSGMGRAVNDRLLRAAHGHVVLDAGPDTVERVRARISASHRHP